MADRGDFAQTLKQQADIVRIVGDYVKLKKAGAQNFTGLCPFHDEKTPSFGVHVTKQFFHCFGCGASGDVFAFVQKIENISFPEAVRTVAQKLGVPLPKAGYDSPAEARDAKIRMALLDVHERACAFFQECLKRPEGAFARQYLAGRGLNEEIIARFRIGYAPDSGFLLRDRLRGEFDEDLLRDSGLFSWKESSEPNAGGKSNSGSLDSARDHKRAISAMYAKFRHRVMFPISNENGRVIAFTGRALSADEKAGPKYFNSPETAIYSKSKVLFNLDKAKEAIRKLDYAILVEGQMDCISVYAAGFHNVIASSGTAFTELQARLLGRFSKQVVVNFDPDTAGAKATERTLGLLVQEDFQIKVLTLEPGFDPDLFIRRKGKQAYADALKKSQRYFDYLIERARAQFPSRNAEGKIKAVNYLLPHVQRVPSRIARDELVNEIAQRLGIDSAVLRQELKHAAVSRSAATMKATPEAQVTDAEKILIRALASVGEIPASDERTSSREGADEEFDPARQAQFALRSEHLHAGLATESLIDALLGATGAEDLLQLAASDSDRALLAAILLKQEEPLTVEGVEGAIRALRRKQIRRRLEQLQGELVGIRDSEGRHALFRERERLARALKDAGTLESPAAAGL